MDDNLSGALISPDDPNDIIYEYTACGSSKYYQAVIPEEYDMRKYSKPARNQGNRSTCAAFCAATIKEIQEKRENNYDNYMSPEFIYFHRVNKPGPGMYGRNVFQILQEIGSVPEYLFPYLQEDKSFQIDERIYEIASHYRIYHYARVITCDGLKRALLELGPCYLQLLLYTTRPYFWRPQLDEKPIGGHAVTVIGFNKEGFILKNSWGPNWNGDGCVIFPYDEWKAHLECWVSIDKKIFSKYTNKKENKAPLFKRNTSIW